MRIGAGKWLHVWRVGSKVLALTFGDVITSKVLSWPFVVHALTHAAYAFIANRCPAVAIPAYSPGGKHWTAHFYIIAIRWRISLRTDNAAAAPSWPSSGPACPPPRLLASSPPRPRYTRGPHAIRLRSHRRCTCACCFSAALSPPDSEYRPKRDRKTLFPLIPLSAHHHSALPISA